MYSHRGKEYGTLVCTLCVLCYVLYRVLCASKCAMYSVGNGVYSHGPSRVQCTLSVLCLYSECTFGAQRGVRKVQTEYTSCAEYNVKYVEYIQSIRGST